MSNATVPGQDMPPKGGFSSIRYERRLPKRGPSGVAMFAICGAVMGYGWYRLYLGLDERRELDREKIWSRIHLTPMLLAETDRDEYRRNHAAVEREREIMKDIPGWEAGKSVYNGNRYMPMVIANVPLHQRPDFKKD
ncbi:hypothetical protein GGI01_002716 [Coemansia sp. RSA 376]|nr:hypothetical protein LPJ71_006585 [Coemansia sp. S17]KAJ2014797.1 hypothetical protein GGI14_004644 [Coemansia sp. S680]KAJ2038087.1 hypothetical protein H4S03_002555 [Coemansia sp. S3946]KAJ2046830.1 hypothetical protein H4S04_004816 [Coemansia sp. S16]KAJ2051718.1 hypothetical protein GGI08_005194 [Coemansia sp. S2]KAJ2087701.1 hypothetical protein GGI16_006429 [Coemansia sp. S142-1]KAJ2099552.1 hypothetical protein GGI09_002725 [Coemansia sp. S100]KAJ2111744.1 hypothetical protein IW14